MAALVACEDSAVPVPAPDEIELLSGDAQYTRKGTELEAPVVVRVELEDGEPAAGVAVRFQVIEGGGSLSRTTATTSSSGRASVRWTVGPDTGANQLRVSVVENTALTVVASATAAEYYCPEEDPTFTQKFFNAHDFVLLTRASSLTQGQGLAVAGLVRIVPDFPFHEFVGTSLQNYDEGSFDNVVRDCAFSANGDLYISWNNIRDEVMKVAANGTVSHFATLESSFGAEIAMVSGGVLVGCDERGPFAVTCRDTLFRYEDATFSGNGRDSANNDALAVDPASGSLYFIYKFDRTLRKIPLDGITQTGPTVGVVTLPIDESDGARGMVVDEDDGSVYILVESDDTKSIVKVTSAGVRTTEVDFFVARGPGDAAGIQSDLAIDQQYRFLYTLDTKNDVLLVYQIALQDLFELVSSADPEAASNGFSSGERVGLDVLPGP